MKTLNSFTDVQQIIGYLPDLVAGLSIPVKGK